jgi:hypothetical protein
MDPLTVAKLWLLVKPVKRIRQWRTKRKMRSWHEEHGGPPDEILEDFNSQPDEVSMDAVKGALRSRLIWLGLAQVVYGLVQLWADGMLTIESAGPVLGGAVTIWLRAVTKDSLADKAK